MAPHLHIRLDDCILSLRSTEEIDEAADALVERDLAEAPVWFGSPDVAPLPAGCVLTDEGCLVFPLKVEPATPF